MREKEGVRENTAKQERERERQYVYACVCERASVCVCVQKKVSLLIISNHASLESHIVDHTGDLGEDRRRS